MFTGLVQALGIVLAATETAAGKRLTVSLSEIVGARIEPGDSVCVSGVCLTVVKRCNGNAQFDVISETLNRSTLGKKKAQDRVNLELSLRPDSYVGGHFVQGHVDAVAEVAAVKNDPEDYRITFRLEAARRDAVAAIVPKGSVAVDGVSMTVAEVDAAAGTFTLAVIPMTLEKTTLSGLAAGDAVNVETDMISRTVVHVLRNQFLGGTNGVAHEAVGGVMPAKLRGLGMT
jgi:riboflavin synthase